MLRENEVADWGRVSDVVEAAERYAVVNADAVQALARIPDASVDAIITDPPYMLGSASTRRGVLPQNPVPDWTNASVWYHGWMAQAFRAMKPAASLWMFGNMRTYPVVEMTAQSLGRRIISTVVWDKDWIGVGSMKGLRCRYELIFLLGNAEMAIANRSVPDIWVERWASARKSGHPSEKPAGLIERVIETLGIADKHRLIVDPFCGSGVVGSVAVAKGCRFVGADLDEKWAHWATVNVSTAAKKYPAQE